ncbi:MAG TPA: tripartite tricarboxylate transporter substrate binding protein BugE [Limnobacter sp.]|nr:tripartite tricarboxylate transporter substrate binding protein BugE [Limnobacter sp.]
MSLCSIRGVVGGIALLMSLVANAQSDYPNKTVTLVVPFAAGGTTDIVARIVADKLSKELGQAVVVDNRGGGGGSIGTGMVAKAAPDGYTLGVSTFSTHAVLPACNPKLAYHPVKDFKAITNMARVPNVLTVNPKFPAQDFAQYLAHVKQNPDKLSYATSGQCSIQQMVGEQFQLATGTKILHVPYRGAGPALNDLLGGSVDMMFDNLPSSMSHIQSNRLKALAVAWPKRVDGLPNVPTFAELGLPAVNDSVWYGLVAPAGTPDAIVKRLHEATVKVLAMPDLQERFRKSGAEPVGNQPAEHAAEIASEMKKMADLVKRQNIQFDGS